MDILEEYQSHEEKQNFFHCGPGYIYGDVETIFQKFEELQKEDKYLFRGVNNAKYKLYNTAQREFYQRGLFAISKYDSIDDKYNAWINQILQEVKKWNNSFFEKYFKTIDVDRNVLTYLSYMQHSGIPTPLLDFTHDPFIALFFATQGRDFNTGNIDLESCFSIYYIDKTTLLNKVINVDSKRNGLKRIPETEYDDFIKNNPISIIENNSSVYKVSNNLNIINQRGCFVLNWHTINPLEIAYSKFIEQLNTGVLTKLNISIGDDKIQCWDIHMSLIPKIRQDLKINKGIDAQFVCPNLMKDKDILIDKSIINLLS